MATESSPLPEQLDALLPLIAELPDFAGVIDALRNGQEAAVDSAWGSACALTAAAVADRLAERPLLIILPTVRDAEEFTEQFAEFLPGRLVSLFPAWDSLPDEHDITEPVFASRLATLNQLASGGGDDRSPLVIVTALPALLQPVPSREALEAATRQIRVGEEVDLTQLTDWLIERSFERVTAVELPGEFSVHGGIFDVFPPTEPDPIRIELFGDEVESVRSFNVETQRRIRDLQDVAITATRPVTGPVEDSSGGSSADSSRGDGRPAPHHALAGQTASLIDALPSDTVVVFSDLPQIVSEGKLYLQRLSNPVGLFGVDATLARLADGARLDIEALGADTGVPRCRLPVEALSRFADAGRDALYELAASLGETERALIACHNKAERKRIDELLQDVVTEDSSATLPARLRTCVGRIDRGFRFHHLNLLVVGDNELFSRSRTRNVKTRRRTPESRVIDTFLDLREGDLVVHVTQGIARFRGIILMEQGDDREEHLVLEFRDGVMVYVPVSLIHLVQKYIGPAKFTPDLSKVGGTAWEKKKEKIADAVTDMASDMLKLQAERDSKPGLQCSPDSQMQEEFDNAFPYIETPDQVTAIVDIKSDMERTRPMDRLLCGDVGFGKTEVAMRAVFKAVDNGRQAAMLVPTTVLAEQHYRTFTERMAEFPVRIEMLSRFRTNAEAKRILEATARGEVDVLIGTHRLVSKDVEFRDLGLLVIDEEQKFGVKVKDRLKHLRLEVDVLTLTATPIPRTLHLSLLGVRDISSLTTPPRDRMPIETRVSRYDAPLIRSAVIRELNRGGQVYFIHNRVNDIHVIENMLRALVPEASVVVAHGQLSGDDLENAMLEFVSGSADILLATSIVESGLDIPNANTMIIHRPELFGLADLHQLRGRVGRDRHRAYCYLMLEEGRTAASTALRRLKAIEEFSELGAGFRIAMKDLEIRGAGNILGTEQSGNIAAVGYELYCQLLENAVRSLKKKPLRYQTHVKVELPVTAYLPDRYLPEQKLKIEIYRRLSQVNSLKRLEQLQDELRDRFGPVPTPAKNMLRLREAGIRARSWKIESLHLLDDYVVMRYRDGKLIRMLAHLHNGHLKVVDQHDAYWPLEARVEDGAAILEEVLGALSAADPPQPD